MPETAAKQAKILDDEHRLTTILASLNSNRERLMVLLSLKAGLRAVEIASLTWGCIRESDTVIELLRTKGGKARSVPINKDLMKALRDYRADCKRTNGQRPALSVASQRSDRTALGQRRCAMVPGSLYPPPRLGRLQLALRPAQLRHPGCPQRGEGRRLAPRRTGPPGACVSQHDAAVSRALEQRKTEAGRSDLMPLLPKLGDVPHLAPRSIAPSNHHRLERR
jgi:integrase